MSHSAVVPARRRRRLRSASPAAPPPEPINPAVFYNESEAAAFLRLRNPRTLTVWRSRGEHPELKHVKAYGRVLYRGQAILDFLSGTAKPPKQRKR